MNPQKLDLRRNSVGTSPALMSIDFILIIEEIKFTAPKIENTPAIRLNLHRKI